MVGSGPPGIVILVAVAAMLAGCTEDSGDPASVSASQRDPDTTGAVLGEVLDDESLPVAGALVGFVADDEAPGLTAPTDANGAFLLDGIPPGTHLLSASKLGYETATLQVRVDAGQLTENLLFVLTSIPAPDAPYVDPLISNGFLACHANIGFWTLVVNQVCETDPNHNPLYEFDVYADRGLVSIVLELDWTPTTAATGDKVRQELWRDPLCDATHCDASERIGAAQGEPSIKRVYGNATDPIPNLVLVGRTHMGSFALAPNYGDYVGTDVVFQQPVTHYVSLFYNAEPAPDYSLVPPD